MVWLRSSSVNAVVDPQGTFADSVVSPNQGAGDATEGQRDPSVNGSLNDLYNLAEHDLEDTRCERSRFFSEWLDKCRTGLEGSWHCLKFRAYPPLN